MIVARYLMEKAGDELPWIEQEPDHAGAHGYLSFDAGGVEIEVGEFLYGLVRIVKPERILETGTRYGVSAAFMALALLENGRGRLTTIEVEPVNVARAERLLDRAGLGTVIELIAGRVESWTPNEEGYDMIFLDTELCYRFGDMVRFWPYLHDGGILMIHDLHPHMAQTGIVDHGVLNGPYGKLPNGIERMIWSHELQSLHLRTPRGFYLAQKADQGFHSTKLLRTI